LYGKIRTSHSSHRTAPGEVDKGGDAVSTVPTGGSVGPGGGGSCVPASFACVDTL
jgi:hypothetical protein